MTLPEFLKKRIPKLKNTRKIREILGENRIHTVCESAKCPNIGECFSRNTLTFMILGNICTRNCTFCGVMKGNPQPLDPDEANLVTNAVRKLQLSYVVITSVTRDDLWDGGAGQFAKVIRKILSIDQEIKVEALIPDFQGSESALMTVLNAGPSVINHNIETIPRLYLKIRPQADYKSSLKILSLCKNYAFNSKDNNNSRVYTKSGFMVGLGETKGEVFSLLDDLKDAGCDIVTIGQYLPPSKSHLPPARYVALEEFEEYRVYAKSLGNWQVFAGPFIRSSYHAKEVLNAGS